MNKKIIGIVVFLVALLYVFKNIQNTNSVQGGTLASLEKSAMASERPRDPCLVWITRNPEPSLGISSPFKSLFKLYKVKF